MMRNRMRVRLQTAWFAGVLLIASGLRVTAQVMVYDLATDWSDLNNPNGVWQLNKAQDNRSRSTRQTGGPTVPDRPPGQTNPTI